MGSWWATGLVAAFLAVPPGPARAASPGAGEVRHESQASCAVIFLGKEHGLPADAKGLLGLIRGESIAGAAARDALWFNPEDLEGRVDFRVGLEQSQDATVLHLWVGLRRRGDFAFRPMAADYLTAILENLQAYVRAARDARALYLERELDLVDLWIERDRADLAEIRAQRNDVGGAIGFRGWTSEEIQRHVEEVRATYLSEVKVLQLLPLEFGEECVGPRACEERLRAERRCRSVESQVAAWSELDLRGRLDDLERLEEETLFLERSLAGLRTERRELERARTELEVSSLTVLAWP